MKKAFTLIEVNLAMLIMATGVLVMCGLYSLGFRESRQSVEDVAAVSFADTYLGPLVQGLSATNMTWSAWRQIGKTPTATKAKETNPDIAVLPKDGWAGYAEQYEDTMNHKIRGNPRSTADGVWGEVMGQVKSPYKGSRPSISGDYQYGLVVTRKGAVIQLAFRASRRKQSLMSQPIFVAEVRFQGDPEQ